MTTQNLTGIDDIIAQQNAAAKQWKQRAADLLKEREQLDADKAEADANAEMVRRAIAQQFTDKAVPLDEEISQVVAIVCGPSEPVAPAPEPVIPEPAPAPVAPAPVPDPPAPVRPPAPPVNPPTAPMPRVVVPPRTPVRVIVEWTRRLGWFGWIIAILFAILAFQVSGEHMLFRISRTGDGYWDDIQKIIWRTGWTGFGFYIGGSIGMLLRTFLTEYRSNRQGPRNF